jgi:TonB family protein
MKNLISICLGIWIVLASCAIVFGQDTPSIISGGVLNGKATSLPKPEYPAEAKAAGEEGTVVVDVVFDEFGSVMSANAAADVRKINGAEGKAREIQPADPMLRDSAEKAALEAKFSPTKLSGVPVKVSGSIIYKFVLADDSSVVEGGILNGRATALPMPEYPDAAKAVRASGLVAVKVTVDENGDVISATAASGHPLLRRAAVDAAREAKFAPTRLSGEAVKVSGVITYNFVVPEKDN